MSQLPQPNQAESENDANFNQSERNDYDASMNDRDRENLNNLNQTGRSNVEDSSRLPRARPPQQNKNNNVAKKKIEKKQNPERVAQVQTFQSITIYLNAFTVFLTVIFLQILMLRNAVPMTNDILMSSGSSVTYFVMSLITLIFLFACHECASYMVLQYHFCIVLFYGLLILSLGISCLSVDLVKAPEAAKEIWNNVLSANQQEYFNAASGTDPPSGQNELQKQRMNNTKLAGIFGITLGILILVQAVVVFILKSKRDAIVNENIEWLPTEMKSRGIQISGHQKCEFPYIVTFEDKQLNMLGLGKGKKKKLKDVEEENSDDEYDFDEDEELDYQIIDRAEENHHSMGAAIRNQNDPASKTNNSQSYDQDGQDSYRGSTKNRSMRSGSRR